MVVIVDLLSSAEMWVTSVPYQVKSNESCEKLITYLVHTCTAYVRLQFKLSVIFSDRRCSNSQPRHRQSLEPLPFVRLAANNIDSDSILLLDKPVQSTDEVSSFIRGFHSV